MTIEVVVYNVESALKAQEGGADRIELCDNPAEGGTTPSIGCVEVVRQALNIDVYVMIRPRGGDFHYSRYEFHSMKRDIRQCQKLSVDGFVLGILTPDGRIDKERCRELIDMCRPLKVTCHRAFDMTRDPAEALEDCIEVGFDRILTSGRHLKAIDGVDVIARMVKQAAGRVSIMAGSGVTTENVQELVERTRVNEIHTSASTERESLMTYRNSEITGMGGQGGKEFRVRTVDVEMLRKLRALAETIHP